MSHDFKFKINEMKDNNPVKQEQNYQHASQVRNVCFVQADGKMLFLNYGYLVSGEYLPDESVIVLNFTSHTITLKGTKLEPLYKEFLFHIPKFVSCIDKRYAEIETSSFIINEIEITEI